MKHQDPLLCKCPTCGFEEYVSLAVYEDLRKRGTYVPCSNRVLHHSRPSARFQGTRWGYCRDILKSEEWESEHYRQLIAPRRRSS